MDSKIVKYPARENRKVPIDIKFDCLLPKLQFLSNSIFWVFFFFYNEMPILDFRMATKKVLVIHMKLLCLQDHFWVSQNYC